MVASEVAMDYLVLVALLILFFYFWLNKIRNLERMHLHHYIIGMMIMVFTSDQCPYITALNGVATGMMIDGVATWGFDPLFNKPKPDNPWNKKLS